MTTIFTAAILALWASLSPNFARGPERLAIARAIATVHASHLGDAPLLGVGHLHDALVEGYYAIKESEARRYPVPISWDATAGVSCGFLQEPCEFVAKHPSDLAQAAWWYNAVKARGLESVDSSPTRAHLRTAFVTSYLEKENGTATDDVAQKDSTAKD